MVVRHGRGLSKVMEYLRAPPPLSVSLDSAAVAAEWKREKFEDSEKEGTLKGMEVTVLNNSKGLSRSSSFRNAVYNV